MYDKYKTYTGAFLIAGLPPMIFGILLTSTRYVRKSSMEPEERNPNEPKLLAPTSESHEKEGKQSAIIFNENLPLLLSNKNITNYTN
jgi:hypothetical protein